MMHCLLLLIFSLIFPKKLYFASVNAALSNVTYDYTTTITDIVSIATDMNSKTHTSLNNAQLKKVNLVDEQNRDPNISRILQFKSCRTRLLSKQRKGKVLLCVNCCMNWTGCLFVIMASYPDSVTYNFEMVVVSRIT